MDKKSIPALKERVERFLVLASLSDWENRTLVHLLFGGVSKPADIASAARVPANKIYQVLKNLENKALVYQPTKAGRATEYRAVRPEEMFDLLTQGPQEMMRIRTDVQELLSELYEGAAAGVDESRIENFIQVNDTPTAVQSMLMGALKGAKEEILVRGQTLQWLTSSTPLMGQLRARAAQGVKVRALAQVVGDEQRAALADGMSPGSFQLRQSQRSGSPLVIIDRSEAFVGVRKPTRKAEQFSEIFIHSPSLELVEDMRLVFDQDWENALPVASER